MFVLPLAAHSIHITPAKFWIAFGLLFVYGPMYGIAQGTVFAMASILPSAYVGAVMVGGGLSGIVTTIVGMFLVGVMPGQSNLFSHAMIFYLWAMIMLLIAGSVYPMVVAS